MASESPKARLRPTKGQQADLHRNSSIVRASVLETALELGFGQNSTVANWIFNNPLSEEAEDLYPEPDVQVKPITKSDPAPYVAEAITPTLTSGSNSTSDESSSLNSPANIAHNAAIATIQVHSHKPSVTETPCVHFDDFPSDQLQLFSPFALSPHDAHQIGTRDDPMGKFPRDAERSRSQDDTLRHSPGQQPSPGPTDAGYASEGQYLSKAKTGKAKDKPTQVKGKKGTKPKTPDSGKTSEKDGEYASDGGYLSASSNKSLGKSPGKVKSRAMAFFRRRPKKSARGSDDEDEDNIPPVPAIPVLPRPSSPKPLERRAAPSPARPGFSPLTLNLTSVPTSPPKRRVSKSPPPAHARATPPQQSDQVPVAQRPASSLVASASAPTVLTPAATATTFPLPPSLPGTPLPSASFPTTLLHSVQPAAKSLMSTPSRQHLTIPPPAPPPTLPLPQLPTPSASPVGMLQPLPATPTTPSRQGAPSRPIPVVPPTPGTTRPLTPRGAASPFRPLLTPRALPVTVSHPPNGEVANTSESEQSTSQPANGRQRSGTAGFASAPAFLQRKIQTPSPRHPPPDMPLPPSPCLNPQARPRTPIGPPSKFHEHFSSISSVPLSQVLSTPKSLSPSLSTATLSESSSGPSVRSSHISSASERSSERLRDPANALECSRPTTSASFLSESSYGQPLPSTIGRTFGKPVMNVKSHFSDRNDVNSSVYSRTTHPDNGSVTTFNDDDIDTDDAAPRSYLDDDDDDDASVYPSDDKTAGRRTMYLMEHGELDENGDEIVIAGSHYWGNQEVVPPVPPLPPMPTRPGPGYF